MIIDRTNQRMRHPTMNRHLRQLLISLAVWASLASAAFGQASLLPFPNQQFLDNNADPLSAGKVYTYQTDGTTPKTTWKDAGETMPNTNPVLLDSAGRATIYGTGSYSLVVQDTNGVQIYQGISTAPLTTSGGGVITDGTPVGTVLMYSGLSAPAGYTFADGSAISRTTFATYFAAVTLNTTGVCVLGNTTMSGIPDTSQIPYSGAIESTCFAPGTTVVSKASNTVTMSTNATVSTNAGITFFLYGDGDGATTFNLPDLRGRYAPGRDNMGGSTAGRLTAANYGTNPDATGATGGAESKSILQANLPNVNFTNSGITLNDPSHFHQVPIQASSIYGTGSTPGMAPGGNTNSVSNTTGITISAQGHAASGGSGTALSVVPPSITMNYMVKIQ